MDKEQVQKALAELKQQPKRKFSQSYDLIINLKNIEIKSHPLDFFVTLPHPKGRKIKVAALVGQELAEAATKFCDLTIRETEFAQYAADKKTVKKLAEQHDYFIAQANLMGKVAAAFGKTLGVKGKMPNPKMGCVVPPNANLETLVRKLAQSVRLQAKKATNMQCLVGKENQADEEIINNIMTILQAVLKGLPNEEQNIKNVWLKTTMGKPVKVW